MTVLNRDVAIQKYFDDIAQIPHGSFNEQAIADYIEGFAKEQGLSYHRDDMNNIIIYKAASVGYEEHESVMLQGHMDMVNEKNQDSDHDFETDALQLYIEDGFLKAQGTTLGADDGCGVVYMMAILADDNLKHPALECVFTVQEEVGLLGASNIDESLLQSKKMIGLDSGSQHSVCISSSGGRRTIIRKHISFETNKKNTYELIVSGLLGGHSGGEIHKERGNANKIAIRTLYYLLSQNTDIHLVDIFGGLKENAISRECNVIFNSATPIDELQENVNKVLSDLQAELEFSDAGVQITLQPSSVAVNALNAKVSKEIIEMMYILPDGFQHKSMAIEGLTTVSLNMGVVRMENNELKIYYSIRSPMKSAKEELSSQLGCIASLFGCDWQIKGDYPGWQYESDSPLRQQYLAFVNKSEGIELTSEASHGGLETGIFKGKIPELDIITLGPDMYDIHTPDERLNLASFEACYQRLVGFLETL